MAYLSVGDELDRWKKAGYVVDQYSKPYGGKVKFTCRIWPRALYGNLEPHSGDPDYVYSHGDDEREVTLNALTRAKARWPDAVK